MTQIDARRRPAAAARQHPICSEDELIRQGRLLIRIGELEIGVFWVHGRLRAYENRCRHQGGPVCTGMVIGKLTSVLAPDRTVIREELSEDEIHLVCPWHGWEYDLETGELAADRRYRLRRFEAGSRDGQVYIVV